MTFLDILAQKIITLTQKMETLKQEKETIVKESGKQPGAKPKVKLARKKDDDKKKTSNEIIQI